MAWYRTGTVTVTNNSLTVTGVDTLFLSQVRPGQIFVGPDGVFYEIEYVVNDTQLTLHTDNPYQGVTASGQDYQIIRISEKLTSEELINRMSSHVEFHKALLDDQVAWLNNLGTINVYNPITRTSNITVKTWAQIEADMQLAGANLDEGSIQYGNQGTHYWDTWHNNASNTTSWYKIADVYIPPGTNKAASFEIRVINADSYFGYGTDFQEDTFSVALRRSGAVADTPDDAVIKGTRADLIRVEKTAVGTYEIQFQAYVTDKSWNLFIFETSGSDIGRTITWHKLEDSVSATGTGTIYSSAATPDASSPTLNRRNMSVHHLTVKGDLNVEGATITAETLAVADNIITLNNNYTGSSPTENAGIEVERGTLNNVTLQWNETTDKWEITEDGISYYDIWHEGIFDPDLKADLASPSFSGTLTLSNAGTSIAYIAGTASQLRLQSDTSNRRLIGVNNSEVVQSQIIFHDSNAVRVTGTVDTNVYMEFGNSTNTSYKPVHIETSTDGGLRLTVPAGEPNEWNYISFYGSDGVRDTYIGTNATGQPIWFSQAGEGITLEPSLIRATDDLYVNTNLVYHQGNFNPATKSDTGHTHTSSEITDFSSTVNGLVAKTSLTYNVSSVNLGTIIESGFYRIGVTPTDAPSWNDFSYGQLIVSHGADTQAQIFIDYNADEMGFRGGNDGGGWRPWSRVWNSNNFDPTTKADIASPSFTGTVSIASILASSSSIILRPQGTGVDKVTFGLNSVTLAAGYDIIGGGDTEITGLSQVTTSNFLLQSTGPVLYLRDTDSTGAAQSGWISFQDNGSIERAWIGYGSSGNTDLTVKNTQGLSVVDGSLGSILRYNGLTKLTAAATIDVSADMYMNNYYIRELNSIIFNDGTELVNRGGNGLYLDGGTTTALTFRDNFSATMFHVYGDSSGNYGILNTGGAWRFRLNNTTGNTYIYGNNTGVSNVNNLYFTQSDGTSEAILGVQSSGSRDFYIQSLAGHLMHYSPAGYYSRFFYDAVEKLRISSGSNINYQNVDMNNNEILNVADVRLIAGGAIYSNQNNAEILKDHANGNVTVNAAGGELYLGFQNTTGVILSSSLRNNASDYQILSNSGNFLELRKTAASTSNRLQYEASLNYLFIQTQTTGATSTPGEQAGGIAIGESANSLTGTAALRLSYTGDGWGHIGNGGWTSATDVTPVYSQLSFSYNSDVIRAVSDFQISDGYKLRLGTVSTDPYFSRSGNYARLQSQYGYADIGANNTSYFHFYTDRSAFYFGDTVRVEANILPHANLSTDAGGTANRFNNVYALNGDFTEGTNGSYAVTSGSGTNWASTIWGIGPTFCGTAAGSTYDSTGVYGISWVRGTSTYYDAAIGEGLYIYTNGSLEGGIGTSGMAVYGNIVVSGTVDGRDVAVDGSKLDGLYAARTTGNNWGATPQIDTSGILEGMYGLHFHGADASTENDWVIQLSSTAANPALYFYNDVGTLRFEFLDSGDFRADGDITAYYSDIRLKDVSGIVTNCISSIMAIDPPIRYTATKHAEKISKGAFSSEKKEIGLSAQSVQKIFPELVKRAPFDTGEDGHSISGEDYLTLKYERLIPVLLGAIQEQQGQIDELKKRLEKIE